VVSVGLPRIMLDRAGLSHESRPLGLASLAGEARLDIGQPGIVRPSVTAYGHVAPAPVIRAIDQEPANASGAHLGEGDLLLAGEGGHAPLKRAVTGFAIGQTANEKRTAVLRPCCADCSGLNGKA
jgi:hypothetical protein